MPRLYILSGCNGSGKTTASYTLLPELFACSEFVNSDEFAKYLSPFDPGAVSVSASRYMLAKIHYLLGKRVDFSIETTLATRSLVRTIQQAKEFGYSVSILYFWVNSPELAIERVHARVLAGGHNIPDETVRRRYKMGLKYFFELYSVLCDDWVLADNSKSPFTIVAEGDKTNTYIRNEELYELIKQSSLD